MTDNTKQEDDDRQSTFGYPKDQPDLDDLKMGDTASNYSRSSTSSVRSRTRILRMEEEQRSAEVQARCAALAKKHDMALAKEKLETENRRLSEQILLSRLELKRQEEQLNLDTEMNICRAKVRVIDQFDADNVQGASSSLKETDNTFVKKENVHSSNESDTCAELLRQPAGKQKIDTVRKLYDVGDQSHPKYSSTPSHTEPSSTRQKEATAATESDRTNNLRTVPENPGSNVTEFSSAISSLAAAFANREENLPKKEPDVFCGDVFEFPVWLNSFIVLVEERYSKASDRMYYLGKYT